MSASSAIRSAAVDTVATTSVTIATRGAGFTDITAQAARFIADTGAGDGLLTLFVRHTSASLTIQENADPAVRDDLMMALDRLAPESVDWSHDMEGPDDMPAHVKTMLTATALQVPVVDGRLTLGTWQAIYLIEHRASPHIREVVLQFIGARSA